MDLCKILAPGARGKFISASPVPAVTGCGEYRNGATSSDAFLCRKLEAGVLKCMPPNQGDGNCPGDHECYNTFLSKLLYTATGIAQGCRVGATGAAVGGFLGLLTLRRRLRKGVSASSTERQLRVFAFSLLLAVISILNPNDPPHLDVCGTE